MKMNRLADKISNGIGNVSPQRLTTGDKMVGSKNQEKDGDVVENITPVLLRTETPEYLRTPGVKHVVGESSSNEMGDYSIGMKNGQQQPSTPPRKEEGTEEATLSTDENNPGGDPSSRRSAQSPLSAEDQALALASGIEEDDHKLLEGKMFDGKIGTYILFNSSSEEEDEGGDDGTLSPLSSPTSRFVKDVRDETEEAAEVAPGEVEEEGGLSNNKENAPHDYPPQNGEEGKSPPSPRLKQAVTSNKNNSSNHVTFHPSTPDPSCPDAGTTRMKRMQTEFECDSIDVNKSVPELLRTVSELRDETSRLGIDYSAEKALRRKKEKNLIKLATQLNHMAQNRKEREAEMAQLRDQHSSLKANYESARQSLETLTLRHGDLVRSHHKELTSYQSQLRDVRATTNEKIVQLTSNHANECEELRGEILRANKETDLAREELAKLKLEHVRQTLATATARGNAESSRADSPEVDEGVRRIVEIAVEECITRQRQPRGLSWVACFCAAAALVSLRSGFIKKHASPFSSFNALCAPVKQGVTLINAETPAEVFEAPWWAPPEYKSLAFEFICTCNWSQSPIAGASCLSPRRLEWSPSRKGATVRISHAEDASGGSNASMKKTWRGITRAEVSPESTLILTGKRKGREVVPL